MPDVLGAMGSAIFSKLAGGTALIAELGGTAIFQGSAPDGYDYPFVVFVHQAGGPENITPRDYRNHVWMIKGYSTRRDQANRIDGHIDDLFHRGSLAVSGWTTFWLVRELDASLEELLPNNEVEYMAGAAYRIRISE